MELRALFAPASISLNDAGRLISPLHPIFTTKQSSPAVVAFPPDAPPESLFRPQLSGELQDTPLIRIEATLPDGTLMWAGLVHPNGDVDLTGDRAFQAATFVGPATWTIRHPDHREAVWSQVINMEIYILAGPPDPVSLARGLPLEWLRENASAFFRQQPPHDRSRFLAASIAQLAEQVFSQNPPRYDVWHGRSSFISLGPGGWNDITFHNRRYQAARTNPASICNCYDAASYLQVLLNHAGYKAQYCYMEPFGYLEQTPLIGRGQCNNPFYAQRGDPPVLPDTDQRRTAFGNHAFCGVTSGGRQVIADACAGPHRGTESITQYVASATDATTPRRPRVPRGTATNVRYYRGVTSIDARVPLDAADGALLVEDSEPLASQIAEFQRALEITLPPVRRSVDLAAVRWPDPLTYPELNRWRKILDDISAGYPEASRQWVLVNDAGSVQITIYVSHAAPEHAFRRFLLLGAVHQADVSPFERGPASLGEVSAQALSPGRAVYIWTRGSAAFEVSATYADVDVSALAHWLDHFSRESVAAVRRSLRQLSLSNAMVRVGETVTVHVDCEPGSELDIAVENDALMLVEKSANEFVFLTRRSSDTKVAVVAVDPRTLVAEHAHTTIHILP